MESGLNGAVQRVVMATEGYNKAREELQNAALALSDEVGRLGQDKEQEEARLTVRERRRLAREARQRERGVDGSQDEPDDSDDEDNKSRR